MFPRKNLTAQETREVALDRLFASLHKTSDEQAAKAVEEKIWELWSRFDSPTAEVLLGQAVVAMGASENAASLEILDRIVAAYPAYAEAWNKRATLQFVLGNYDASSDGYRESARPGTAALRGAGGPGHDLPAARKTGLPR